MPVKPKLIDKLVSRLPRSGVDLLSAVRRYAESSTLRIFLVGGTVRDLLLDRASIDVDVAVEGDAVRLARKVAKETGARLVKTTRFGTATLRAEDFALDLATARAETYARPGALPKVHPAGIEDDLLRRDFTINAIALQLSEPGPGKLIDPTGGAADVKAGLVRALHDRSFQDDATRIIRAVRYEARYSFRIEERTHDLLSRDLSYLDTISGTRIRQELARTFAEDEPERALARLENCRVLGAIHPSLSLSQAQADAARRLRLSGGGASAFWPLLCWNADDSRLQEIERRLALTRVQSAAVRAIPLARSLERRLAERPRPSEAARLLEPLPLATAQALAVLSPSADARECVRSYLFEWRMLRPALRGDDLIKLGVLRGPDVGDVLALLRAAKLDGEIKTLVDEEGLVEEFLARERAGLA